VEQNRAPTLLVHVDGLARSAAAFVRDHRQPDGKTANWGGLVVRARLDRRKYAIRNKVTAKELRALQIDRENFHGDWNYVIRPRKELQ
jgi:hypothetical protein